MNMILVFIPLLTLYFLSALFSCMETVYTSVNRAWLRDQAEQGDARAGLVCRILDKASDFFCTVLLGNNLVNVSLTTLVHSTLSVAVMESSFGDRIMLTFGIEEEEEIRSLLTTFITVPTVLLFSEFVPKAVGRHHADSLALSLSGILNLLRILLKLPVAIIAAICSYITKRIGGPEGATGAAVVSRDDLRVLADLAAEQGLIPKETEQVMNSVLNLENMTVSNVMVPLFNVKSLPLTASVADVEHLAAATGFTRFPVYGSRIDEIIGLVSLRDCMFRTSDYENSRYSRLAGVPIRNLVDRNVLYVPENKTVSSLLEEFRNGAGPMAVVVDEYGGMTGVITTEDLIAMLVGGIADRRNQNLPQKMIVRQEEGVFECDGRTDIRDLEAVLGKQIFNSGFSTAAGFVLDILGRIPDTGDKAEYENYCIEVVEVQMHRISKLRFTKK